MSLPLRVHKNQQSLRYPHLFPVPPREPQSSAEAFDFRSRLASVQSFSGRVAVGGAVAQYAHFRSSDPIEATPIQIVNGFMGTGAAYVALGKALAMHGRHATVIKPTRHQRRFANLHPDHLADVLLLPAQVNHKVARAVADRWHHAQTDMLAHSMGNNVAAKYAAAKPSEIRSLMSTGPAGLDGPAGFRAMVGRLGMVLTDEIWAGRNELLATSPPSIVTETSHYMFRHPLRTVREGIAASTFDARPDMSRAQAAGVKLGAIIMEEDRFFDPNDILYHSGDMFDKVTLLIGSNHIDPQTHPVEHAWRQVVAFHDLNYGEPAAPGAIAVV